MLILATDQRRDLFCASVSLILFYAQFFECMTGLVVSSFQFPTCPIFLTAVFVHPVSAEPNKRVPALHVVYKKLWRTCRGCTRHSDRLLSSGSQPADTRIKLSCFAPFSQRSVMMRLASSLQRNSRNGTNQMIHALLLASSQNLWRHVLSPAPGSHIYLSSSLPLISRID